MPATANKQKTSTGEMTGSVLKFAGELGIDERKVQTFLDSVVPEREKKNYLEQFAVHEVIAHFRYLQQNEEREWALRVIILRSGTEDGELKIWAIGDDKTGIAKDLLQYFSVHQIGITSIHAYRTTNRHFIFSAHFSKEELQTAFFPASKSRKSDVIAAIQQFQFSLLGHLRRFYGSQVEVTNQTADSAAECDPVCSDAAFCERTDVCRDFIFSFQLRDPDRSIERKARLRVGSKPEGARMPKIANASTLRSLEHKKLRHWDLNPESPIDPAVHAGLADENRVKIFMLLVREPRPLSVVEVAEKLRSELRIDYAKVARHLRILGACDLVTRERSGKEVRYSINFTAVAEYLENVAAMLKDAAPCNDDLKNGQTDQY